MAAMHSLGSLGSLGGDLLNQNNQSEAGPEVALLNNGQYANDAINFNDTRTESTTTTRHSSSTTNIIQENVVPMDGSGSYDSRTITKQTLSKLQINSKFGTFTRKTCESIEKFNFNPEDEDNNASVQNGMDVDYESEGISGHGAQRQGSGGSSGGASRFANGSNEDTGHSNEFHQRHLNGSLPTATEKAGIQGLNSSDGDGLRQLNGDAVHGSKAPWNSSPNANRRAQCSPQQARRGSPSRQPTRQTGGAGAATSSNGASTGSFSQMKPSAFVSPLMMTGRSHGPLSIAEHSSSGICNRSVCTGSERGGGGGTCSQSEGSCGNLDADSQTENALLVDARLLDDQVSGES
ncbi:hypothetical protein BIW11_05385 [Tropilaelaps mercedesae]|uniref:Uncharacterized protein n=1 Tax=Tropilaelaps mercedesae TaxID=418985 RepID=A0A1V9Y2M9_9ACAR|nr:hypothetical protein BIW11_05385 [Tropilaelaps mercedesae]